jgi:hypothetical protein
MTIPTANFPTGSLDVNAREIFDADISDAALEIAAAMARDRAASLTIAFCSGLDECPHHAPPLRARAM